MHNTAYLNFKFKDYLEELICICEIIEIPGMRQKREKIVHEMLSKYPDECEEIGIEDDRH